MVGFFWFVACIGSQFYIFSSGTPQPAHMVLVLLFSWYLLRYGLTIRLDGIDIWLVRIFALFVFYALFVNVIWSIKIENVELLKSMVFWIFSFFLFFFLLTSLNDRHVRRALRYAAYVGIILLFIFWVTGLGRYDFAPRFNAYFNDPNQMAFWVICMLGTFFFLSKGSARYALISLALVSLFVVLSTQSRSALLGVFFPLIACFARFSGIGSNDSGSRKIIYIIFGLIVLPCAAYIVFGNEVFNTAVERFSTTDFESQADIRGYTRLFEFPEYLFFGAGQGADLRFGSTHEIHSSWAALLFYYGLVGFFVFFVFIYNIFKELDYMQKLVFTAPLLYGISTYGLRTPAFWFFIAAAVYAAKSNARRENGS